MEEEEGPAPTHTQKRAKTGGAGQTTEEDDSGAVPMAVDGQEPMEEGKEAAVPLDVRQQVAAYLATAESKPHAPDLAAFLENPFNFHPESACLVGSVDQEANTALICATKAGAEKAIFVLLHGKDTAYVNQQNTKGVTALNVASHRGYVEPVRELLVVAKADVNIPNTSGSTSLIQASHFGHTEVVRLLLKHGALVDLPNHKGTTALMRAAQEGHVAVVGALLDTGADVNKRNHERMNALMLASQRGHDAIVKMLINQGADIDCQTVQGSTALMLACKRQHEAVVKVLLTAGAEMFVKDSRGRTARDTALKRNNKNIISMLQGSRQVRLMQSEVRVERSYLLMKLYELNCRKRAFPIIDLLSISHSASAHTTSTSSSSRTGGGGGGGGLLAVPSTEGGEEEEDDDEATGPPGGTQSQETLARVFELPFSLFQCVIRYLPWPRIWPSLMPMLHKRCHVDANEALRGALTIMDEVITDLNVFTDPVQEHHLVRALKTSQTETAAILRGKHRMPGDLVETLLRWNDAQSILSRFDKAVTFNATVADRAVKDAARLCQWYRLGGDGGEEEEGPREDEGTGVEMGQEEEEEDDEDTNTNTNGGGGGGGGAGPLTAAAGAAGAGGGGGAGGAIAMAVAGGGPAGGAQQQQQQPQPPQPQQQQQQQQQVQLVVTGVPPGAGLVVTQNGDGIFMQVVGDAGAGGGVAAAAGGGGGNAAETGSESEG